jgi:phospholipase C
MEGDMQTRRDFLKFATMMSGGAGLSAFTPDVIKRAYAIQPDPGSTYVDAEHIVVLMQENRSFDHAFGSLQGVRGFNDPRAIRLANGNSVFVQTNAAGVSYAPWRMGIRDTKATWMGSLPHSRESQVDAWNNGRHDGWLEAKKSHSDEYAKLPLTMGHYTREDLPFYYALADAFTICDQNYCSAMTSTTPNRSFLWTGTVRNEQRVDSDVFMRNDEIEVGGMTWPTYPERLQKAGVSWKCYQNELTRSGGLSHEEHSWLSNFTCNLLEYFSAYNVEAYPDSVLGIQERMAALTPLVESLERKAVTSQSPRLQIELERQRAALERLRVASKKSGEALYKELSEQQRALHDSAFVTNAGDPHFRILETLKFEDANVREHMQVPAGDIFHQFRKDVNQGKLPTISWLVAPSKFSDHPALPWYGAWYVSEAMNILTSNPAIWKKTIFILTYDENDGYFDHAPVFVAADPKRPETGRASEGINTGLEYTYAADELKQGASEGSARSGPIGMGFRVPMIIASPWSRGGWVNSQLFDHTSVLMFMEQFLQKKYGKNVQEENLSAWRRVVSGDLISAFRPYHPDSPGLHYVDRNSFAISIQEARNKQLPSGFSALTQSEVEEINRGGLHSSVMPKQEPGTRQACAIPYEFYADGSLDLSGKQFNIQLKAGKETHKESSAGTAFNVYLHNLLPSGENAGNRLNVATYTVGRGQQLQEAFPLSLFEHDRYSIEVHAPNGFYRSFRGNSTAKRLTVQAKYEQKNGKATGNIVLSLANPGDQSLPATITDNAYKAATKKLMLAANKEQDIPLDLSKSHNWYDFTVSWDEGRCESRFAGHVDDGVPSVTDPFMGGLMSA